MKKFLIWSLGMSLALNLLVGTLGALLGVAGLLSLAESVSDSPVISEIFFRLAPILAISDLEPVAYYGLLNIVWGIPWPRGFVLVWLFFVGWMFWWLVAVGLWNLVRWVKKFILSNRRLRHTRLRLI